MDLRILEFKDERDVIAELRALKVHRGGVEIMAPKAILRIIKIRGMDSAALNILKQEMLSVGGDCAVAWNSFIKRSGSADGIMIGTVAQIDRLCEKLNRQPFGLPELGRKIQILEEDYKRKNFALIAGKHILNLGARAYIMGILNITPDSFSDGGRYLSVDKAVERACEMESEGADIIDIGGESTRPGAKSVSAEEECKRVIPAIKLLVKRLKTPISIDTSKALVARKALDSGAVIVNDVSGLKRDLAIAPLAAKYKAAVVVMHMKGAPRTMQKHTRYKSLICDIIGSLRQSVRIAKDAGISDRRIVIDPGIGFGKTAGQNLEILKRLGEFKSLGYPILVGTSRKYFIGKILNVEIDERIFGTAASVAIAVQNGANILRVHDVGQMRQAAQLSDAILRC